MNKQADTAHDLHRIVRQYRPRLHAWYDRHKGELVFSNAAIDVTPHASIATLLQWAHNAKPDKRPHTIYITGGELASDRPGHDPADDMAIDRYWAAPCLNGWEITSWRRDPWRVSYRREGVQVDVAMGSVWYGEEHDARKCHQAHVLLGAMLRHVFDQHATLMGSPGRTGADLVQRSLPPGANYPRLPEDIRELLTKNFGQGRLQQNELYKKPESGEIPGVYALDMRWAYASCMRHLPVAPVTYTRKNPEYKGFRKAIYHVQTRVPDHWDHMGLAPTWSRADERTVWPSKPGTFIESSWLTGAELAVMYEQGWPVNMLASVVYAPEDAPGHDPARVFIEKMTQLREWATINASQPLVAQAVRKLIIYTVGYFFRGQSVETRWLPYLDNRRRTTAIPANALLVLPLREGVRYTLPAPLDAVTDPMYRPEWSVQVWGAARAKLNRRMLVYPAERILWLRNDSIVFDSEPAFVADDGKPGTWRVKWSYTRPTAPPTTEAAYREIMRGAD